MKTIEELAAEATKSYPWNISNPSRQEHERMIIEALRKQKDEILEQFFGQSCGNEKDGFSRHQLDWTFKEYPCLVCGLSPFQQDKQDDVKKSGVSPAGETASEISDKASGHDLQISSSPETEDVLPDQLNWKRHDNCADCWPVPKSMEEHASFRYVRYHSPKGETEDVCSTWLTEVIHGRMTPYEAEQAIRADERAKIFKENQFFLKGRLKGYYEGYQKALSDVLNLPLWYAGGTMDGCECLLVSDIKALQGKEMKK